MDDAVANGYQSAISSLSGGPTGRVLPASQRYSGKASSAECLRGAVHAVEQTLRLRPRRRVEVVRGQLEQLAATLAAHQQTREQAATELHSADQRHSRLATHASNQPERVGRAEQRIRKLPARVRKLEQELWRLAQQQRERQERLGQLERENEALTSEVPLVRSPIGMQLQEAFALFAANFVRWAATWVREQVQDVPPALAKSLGEVKTLVKVVAHSRARVVGSEAGCVLVFDAHSAFAGAVLVVRGHPVYQTILPLFTADATVPREVT